MKGSGLIEISLKQRQIKINKKKRNDRKRYLRLKAEKISTSSLRENLGVLITNSIALTRVVTICSEESTERVHKV